MNNTETASAQPRVDAIDNDKRLAHYSACLDAWFMSGFELDKNLLTLSVGATGLLVTLLTTVGAGSTLLMRLYVGSALCFGLAIGAILTNYQCNQTYLRKLLNDPYIGRDIAITALNAVRTLAFATGVMLAVWLGIATALPLTQMGH